MTFLEETSFAVPVQLAPRQKPVNEFPAEVVALAESQSEPTLRGIPESALHD